MATQTFLDKQSNQLIKKFHILAGKSGMDEETRRAFLFDNYKVTSSKELSSYELLEACNKLDLLCNPAAAELDKWRKRVLASIYAYLNALGVSADMDKVKGTATRAAQVETFNAISLETLRALYAAFTKKAKAARNVEAVTAEMINEIKSLN